MFSAETYAKRRAELRRRIGSGLILLPGNYEAPMNYPNNAYNFRQDSTFLYFFGQSLPALAGVSTPTAVPRRSMAMTLRLRISSGWARSRR